jgi:hypothetical protein
MYFTPLIIASALAATAQAWTIPHGLEDGMYVVSKNETGHWNHHFVGSGDDLAPP